MTIAELHQTIHDGFGIAPPTRALRNRTGIAKNGTGVAREFAGVAAKFAAVAGKFALGSRNGA
jgi:hypothetical protein